MRQDMESMQNNPSSGPGIQEVAILGGGCFWCLEAAYEDLPGVTEVMPGYAGGTVKNPCYREVCTGTTGHAEVVRIVFDPSIISYADVLAVFWRLHDPTQLNRQGDDIGTQYRSVIFVADDVQRRTAEASLAAQEASGRFDAPIATRIAPAPDFYPAELDHHHYYRLHPDQAYCRLVIAPKLAKLSHP